MPFINGLLKKKGLQQLVQSCHLKFGLEKTVESPPGHRTKSHQPHCEPPAPAPPCSQAARGAAAGRARLVEPSSTSGGL
jgi:hypothetical protein